MTEVITQTNDVQLNSDRNKHSATKMFLEGRFLSCKNNQYGKLVFYFVIENNDDIEKVRNFIDKYSSDKSCKLPFWVSDRDQKMMVTVKSNNEILNFLPNMKGQDVYKMSLLVKPYSFQGYNGFSASVSEISAQ